MRILGLDRWRIGVSADGYRELFPLWLRDVERIEVPAGPLVPGPLDIGALPPASGEPHDPRLGDAWLAWWLPLVEDTMRIEPPEDTSDPYGLDGLWPALRERATRRVEEFQHWHTARYHAGEMFAHRWDADRRNHDVVRAVEAAFGRRVKPFSLQFTLLPVRDDRVLEAAPVHYLVPERFFLGDSWPTWLRTVVESVA